jgi:hypothetical protein
MIRRRDFIRGCVGAAATIATLKAAQASSSQKIPWWAARPRKGGVGKPSAIDMHAHWSPEPYNKVLAELGILIRWITISTNAVNGWMTTAT